MSLFLLLANYLLLPSVLSAEAFCSLTVTVLDRSSNPVPDIDVQAIENETNRILESTSNQKGEVALCNLSVFPVRLVVGNRNCLKVETSPVVVNWGTNMLAVVFDTARDPCRSHAPKEMSCKLVIRVSGEDGKPISNATLVLQAGSIIRRTDDFGRILLLPNFDTVLSGYVAAEGFQRVNFKTECRFSKKSMEHQVSMRPEGR